MLRNLLVEAHQSAAWDRLQDSIRRLFGYEPRVPIEAGIVEFVRWYRTACSGNVHRS